MRCVKRPEGAHESCAAANREYQANYAFARRHDLTMDEAAIIREHLLEMPSRNLRTA